MRTAALVALLAAGSASVPAAERTSPRMHPFRGTRHTAYAVTFTLRHAAGHSGFLATDYVVRVAAPKGARASCAPRAIPAVTSGEAGARVKVRLRAPTHGWCAGRHRVTIWLQRGPYCPDKTQPCPEFATRDELTGTTHFTVR